MYPQLPFMLLAIGTFEPTIDLFASRREHTQSYDKPGAGPKISIAGIASLMILAALKRAILRHGIGVSSPCLFLRLPASLSRNVCGSPACTEWDGNGGQ